MATPLDIAARSVNELMSFPMPRIKDSAARSRALLALLSARNRVPDFREKASETRESVPHRPVMLRALPTRPRRSPAPLSTQQ